MHLVASSRRPGPVLAPALSRMEIRLPDDSFLMSRLEEFYQEVVQLRPGLAGRSRQKQEAPLEAQQKLLALLRKQQDEAARTGTLLGTEMYRQAKRVMACMADHIFTRDLQPQGVQWPSLESELFHEEARGFSPGGQCLRKLDQLLRQDDPVYRELAAVYFYALALSGDDRPEVAGYLAALGEIVAPAEESSPLFAQSYAHTLAENKLVQLPAPKKWLLVGAAILLAWFTLSWILWAQVSGPVRDELKEIRRELLH